MPIYAQVRLAESLGPGSPPVAHRPWIEGHVVCLVEGDDAGWEYLTEERAARAGDFGRALADSATSLDALMQRPGSVQALQDARGGVVGLVLQGNPYVSGLLLQPSLVRLCREHLGDGFRLCVPGVDEMVAYGADAPNDPGSTALSGFRLNRHPVSPHVYGWDGGESLRVVERRGFDVGRVVIASLRVSLAGPGGPTRADPAFFEEQSVAPLREDHAAQVERCREIGVGLILRYGAAPDGRLSPAVLDAVLDAWRGDVAPDRPDEAAVVAGVGTLVGDLLCAALPGGWVTYSDELGTGPSVRAESGALCHPIDSVHKRLGDAESTIERLCVGVLDAAGGRTGYG